MLIEFSVYPLDGTHLSKDIAKAIEILEATGLPYQLGPMGTCVEGNWDEVLAAVRRCHQAVAQNHERVITSIVIDDRKNQPHSLRDIVRSVKQHLGGRRVPTSDMDREC